MDQDITIRPISSSDNEAIAHIIRSTLTEFGAARPGTVYYDESTDRLSEVFDISGATYYIAECDGVIVGGAGIYPTEGLPDATCELGRMLMERCIDFALSSSYRQIYLETMPELSQAIRLYEKTGFGRLPAPLGASGHFGCGIWMLKQLR